MIIPIAVTGGSITCTLFAVWAHNPTDKDGQYIEQVWKALHYYEELLPGKNTILTGDFNNNTIWDKKHRYGNHSNVAKYLADRRITSTYHLHHNQTQGTDIHPTLYMYRHRDKPYHIDYGFVSADLAVKIQSIEIGDFDSWTKNSDHVPLIVTFDDHTQ